MMTQATLGEQSAAGFRDGGRVAILRNYRSKGGDPFSDPQINASATRDRPVSPSRCICNSELSMMKNRSSAKTKQLKKVPKENLVWLTKDYAKYLSKVEKRGKRKAVQMARAAHSEAQTEGTISLKPRDDNRLPGLEKFDLVDGHRLVTQVIDPAKRLRVFLFIGTHDETQRWLDLHRGYRFVAGADGAPTYTRVTEGQFRPEAGPEDETAHWNNAPDAEKVLLAFLPEKEELRFSVKDDLRAWLKTM